MKWLLSPFLWVGATLVAVVIVYRIWRRKPVLLRGKLGPRVLRMVAILLVMFGLGVDDRPIQAAQPPGVPQGGRVPAAADVPAPLPEITIAQIDQWLAHQRLPAENADVPVFANWRFFKGLYARLQTTPNAPDAARLRDLLRAALKQLPPAFAALIEADLKAWEAGKEPPQRSAKELLDVLKVMHENAFFDPWLISYLWRHTTPLDATKDPQAVEVLTQLARQVRITHALVRAHAQVKPADIGPRAWMSKAGPGPNFTRFGFHRPTLNELGKVYADEASKINLGPWQQDGVALFTMPAKGAMPVLLREGKKVDLKPGEVVRLGRLDALQIPAGQDVTIEHEVFGKLRLPGGQTLLVWDIARLLDDANRAAVNKVVRAALDGKDEAARQIEQALPLTQRALREELKRQPGAPGGAKMRLVLTLFDDAVLLAPPDLKPLPEQKPDERLPGLPPGGGPGRQE